MKRVMGVVFKPSSEGEFEGSWYDEVCGWLGRAKCDQILLKLFCKCFIKMIFE